MLIDGKTAKGYYESLCAEREPYLRRGRDVASLTEPTLLPPSGWASGTTLPTPYQSVGARGISSLSSKMMLALFPPNQSFLRLTPDAEVSAAIATAQGQVQSEVEKQLAAYEQEVASAIERRALRPHLHEVKKHLLVAGNVLLYVPRRGNAKVHHLSNYVVRRDPSGLVLGIVIRENISLSLLPMELRSKLTTVPEGPQQDTAEIYTAIILKTEEGKKDKYHVWQEIEGNVVPNSEGSYLPEHLPWKALRMEPIAGQSYGYGYGAQMLGDLSSLEGLMKSLVEASAASSRLVYLVNPAATISLRQLQECPNGGFVAGLPEDVVPLKADKAADMGVAYQMIETLNKALGFSFLLNQSVQRSGERVTAEEIRFLAQELEDVLAGTYSLLAQEEQLWLATLLLHYLKKDGVIGDIEGIAEPTIITGLEALGRGHDLVKLDTFVAGAQQTLGPEEFNKWVNGGQYLARRGTAVGLNIGGLIRTEEEVAQREQQASQAALMQGATPELIRQGGKALQQGAQ